MFSVTIYKESQEVRPYTAFYFELLIMLTSCSRKRKCHIPISMIIIFLYSGKLNVALFSMMNAYYQRGVVSDKLRLFTYFGGLTIQPKNTCMIFGLIFIEKSYSCLNVGYFIELLKVSQTFLSPKSSSRFFL